MTSIRIFYSYVSLNILQGSENEWIGLDVYASSNQANICLVVRL